MLFIIGGKKQKRRADYSIYTLETNSPLVCWHIGKASKNELLRIEKSAVWSLSDRVKDNISWWIALIVACNVPLLATIADAPWRMPCLVIDAVGLLCMLVQTWHVAKIHAESLSLFNDRTVLVQQNEMSMKLLMDNLGERSVRINGMSRYLGTWLENAADVEAAEDAIDDYFRATAEHDIELRNEKVSYEDQLRLERDLNQRAVDLVEALIHLDELSDVPAKTAKELAKTADLLGPELQIEEEAMRHAHIDRILQKPR